MSFILIHLMECILEKKFTVAGVSTLNGTVKYRFANSIKRDAILRKSGHTDIKLVELPNEMTKDEAVAYIDAHTDFTSVEKPVRKTEKVFARGA